MCTRLKYQPDLINNKHIPKIYFLDATIFNCRSVMERIYMLVSVWDNVRPQLFHNYIANGQNPV